MDEELISKKDILSVTGISYGQLYRWKRKNLIPEEWFIKKSSFTGQETYFPKDKILDRINKIISLKDDMPLDDLANMFSTKIDVENVSEEVLISNKAISSEALDIYKNLYGEQKIYSFKAILSMSILDNTLIKGDITIDEGKLMVDTIMDNYETLQGNHGTIILARKLGVSMCVGVTNESEIIIDKNARIVVKISLAKFIEKLKLKVV
ncbi:YhbD family protein [Clostridium sp.]|uniref:YhbD family protein n=1 Tax=Clostridium sp. TaxID=1506 RepID=UPI002FC7289A